jgi:peptidoglycan/LPS O-acetylase OafA/YrhL
VPVYVLACVAGVLGYYGSMHLDVRLAGALSGTSDITAACLLAKLTLLPAFVPTFGACAFAGNAPLVTVMVEIVLYAVYALAFAGLVWRGRPAAVWIACIVVWVGGLLAFSLFPTIYNWWQNSSVWGFLPYWWIGTAFVHPDVARQIARYRSQIGLMWIAATVVLLLLGPSPLLAEARKLALALLFGTVISRLDQVTVSENNPLVVIGRSSFSLYAMHAPLTYFLCIYGIPWWSILVINLVVGGLVYSAVETPPIKWSKRRFDRSEVSAGPS